MNPPCGCKHSTVPSLKGPVTSHLVRHEAAFACIHTVSRGSPCIQLLYLAQEGDTLSHTQLQPFTTATLQMTAGPVYHSYTIFRGEHVTQATLWQSGCQFIISSTVQQLV